VSVPLNSRFNVGKIPYEILEKIVYSRLGFQDKNIVVKPGVGIDASVIRLGDGFIALACDPITAATEKAGWLSVHINANDVACVGAKPKYFMPTILLPEGSRHVDLEEVMDDMDLAAKELEVSIVAGHTEVTPSVNQPVIAGGIVGVGLGSEPVLSSGCREGDIIVMTKYAGLEGTSVIAHEYYDKLREIVGEEILVRAMSLMDMVSIVREAVAAYRHGASAMHDPTEGGVITGLYELCVASNAEIEVNLDEIPLMEETIAICKAVKIDPYKLLGSGALLVSIRADRFQSLKYEFEKMGIKYSIIGRVLKNGKCSLRVYRRGREVKYEFPFPDAIYSVRV